MKKIVVDGVEYAPVVKPSKEVIIRGNNSGVHIGILKSHSGSIVELENSRRLWSWSGAFTLNEVATRGVDRGKSRISNNIPSIRILDAIEIIPVSAGVDLSTTEKD